MKLRCRMCQAELTLNPDSEEARNAGTDPRQQLRRHLLIHLLNQTLKWEIARKTGWLIDLLCFEPVEHPEKWRRWLQETFDRLVNEVSSQPVSGG